MTTMGILFNPGTPNIILDGLATVEFDALLDENHDWSSEVTTNPVENGSPISDHIQLNPDKFKIEATISDSSIILGATPADGAQSNTQNAFDLLRSLHEDRKTIIVYSKYRTYTDMAISSIGIPRSAASGDALTFSIEFVNVRIVNTQSTKVPAGISKKLDKKSTDAMNKKTDPKKNTGAQQPVTPEKSTSVLSSIANSLSGGL